MDGIGALPAPVDGGLRSQLCVYQWHLDVQARKLHASAAREEAASEALAAALRRVTLLEEVISRQRLHIAQLEMDPRTPRYVSSSSRSRSRSRRMADGRMSDGEDA